jgi:hypothetical protein
MPKYKLPYNPWRVLDTQRARGAASDKYEFAIEKAMIEREYQDCQEPEKCPGEGCTERMFWRATVGVMMCPRCRMMKLHTPDGIKYERGSGFTPEWQA